MTAKRKSTGCLKGSILKVFCIGSNFMPRQEFINKIFQQHDMLSYTLLYMFMYSCVLHYQFPLRQTVFTVCELDHMNIYPQLSMFRCNRYICPEVLKCALSGEKISSVFSALKIKSVFSLAYASGVGFALVLCPCLRRHTAFLCFVFWFSFCSCFCRQCEPGLTYLQQYNTKLLKLKIMKITNCMLRENSWL